MIEEGIGFDRGCQTVIQARQTWGAMEPILPFRVAPHWVKMSPDQVLLPHLALPLMWTALGKGMTCVGWNSETLGTLETRTGAYLLSVLCSWAASLSLVVTRLLHLLVYDIH